MLHVVVARFYADDNAIRYVFPVLGMCHFSHNGPNADTCLESATLNWAPGGDVCYRRLTCLFSETFVILL